MNSLLAETTLQCTTVAAKMLKLHSVKVKNNQFFSLNNFPFTKGECVDNKCKGTCESNSALEAKVNGSVPNFVLKSTRNQSKYLKHINKLFLFYPKDLDVLWLQKSPISITMTSHVPSDTMGLEDSPQSHLAMVNLYGRAFIYPIL